MAKQEVTGADMDRSLPIESLEIKTDRLAEDVMLAAYSLANAKDSLGHDYHSNKFDDIKERVESLGPITSSLHLALNESLEFINRQLAGGDDKPQPMEWQELATNMADALDATREHAVAEGGVYGQWLSERLAERENDAELREANRASGEMSRSEVDAERYQDATDRIYQDDFEQRRNSPPPDQDRTLEVHVRELLAAGDDPAATLKTLEEWLNPDKSPELSEAHRMTVSEEWARELAQEGLPTATIVASLRLNLPDSDLDGHTHGAVASRIHHLVNGTDNHTIPAAPELYQPAGPEQNQYSR